MKYLVTSSEMKEYDNNTIERIGIPALVLMERAALAVRDCIMEKIRGCTDRRCTDRDCRVLIAVSCGNNGADGLALARLLSEEGMEVSVAESSDMTHATDNYLRQRKILRYYQVKFVQVSALLGKEYDVVVDGVFGVGLSRAVSGKYAEVIETLNRTSGMKVAIDIPSGICGTTGAVLGCAFKADMTVTFGFVKRGLVLYPGAEYAGEVRTAKIGIDEHAFFGHEPELFSFDESPEALLPKRKKDGNKGTFGKVLLIAGWETMAGAAVMSALAVLRTGAGMVKVLCGEENRKILQCAVPEAMSAGKDTLKRDIVWADVIIAGPGLGTSAEAAKVLQTAIDISGDMPIILDADALNLLAAGRIKVGRGRKIVMTPHVGEMSRLTGKEISHIKSHIVEVAKAASLDYDSVMVCKDVRTCVAAPEEYLGYLNVSGNSGMATAGSGDVLAGVIGSLIAQGQKPFPAACTGVYLHGLAGDDAAKKHSEYGVTAMRIAAEIEEIMKGS